MAEQMFFSVAGIDARHESPLFQEFYDARKDFNYEVGQIDFSVEELVCNRFGVPRPSKGIDETGWTRDRCEQLIRRYKAGIEFLQGCRNNAFDIFLSDLDCVGEWYDL